MTIFGAISSAVDLNTQEAAPIKNGYVEVTSGLTTVAAALEDMAGVTFNLTTTMTGRILARMECQCGTSSGNNTTGGWAISINAVDGTEIQRFLSGTNDTGALAVQARSASLPAGTYTVKGRFRRVSGTATLLTGIAQLSALFVAS